MRAPIGETTGAATSEESPDPCRLARQVARAARKSRPTFGVAPGAVCGWIADTNPKRQRGLKAVPRLRFGLVWATRASTALSCQALPEHFAEGSSALGEWRGVSPPVRPHRRAEARRS